MADKTASEFFDLASTVHDTPDVAIALYGQCLLRDSRFARAHRNLAVLHRDGGRIDAAEASIRRALELEPQNEAFGEVLQSVLRESGTDAPVAQLLEATLQTYQSPAKDIDFMGRYKRVLHAIGHGNLATVYKAQRRIDDRMVAVKVMEEATASDPDAVASFEQEARIGAKIGRHDGLVHVTDLVPASSRTTGERRPALEMELIEGRPLSVLAESRPPWRQVVKYIVEALEGLQGLHDAGFLHLDVKPHNILVKADQHRGSRRAVLVDYGSALPIGGSADARLRRTGTPRYMAPECHQEPLPTPAADIYSMGMALYHVVMGRPPFANARTIDALCAAQINSPPPDLHLADSFDNGNLNAVFRRAIRKNPAERYGSAKEFREALERVLSARDQAAKGPAEATTAATVASAAVEASPKADTKSEQTVTEPPMVESATSGEPATAADRTAGAESEAAAADSPKMPHRTASWVWPSVVGLAALGAVLVATGSSDTIAQTTQDTQTMDTQTAPSRPTAGQDVSKKAPRDLQTKGGERSRAVVALADSPAFQVGASWLYQTGIYHDAGRTRPAGPLDSSVRVVVKRETQVDGVWVHVHGWRGYKCHSSKPPGVDKRRRDEQNRATVLGCEGKPYFTKVYRLNGRCLSSSGKRVNQVLQFQTVGCATGQPAAPTWLSGRPLHRLDYLEQVHRRQATAWVSPSLGIVRLDYQWPGKTASQPSFRRNSLVGFAADGSTSWTPIL